MFRVEAVRQIIPVSRQPITPSRHPLYSADAEEILLMIACHESSLGRHLRQIADGPDRALFQIEPRTMHDNYTNFFNFKAGLALQIREVTGVTGPDNDQLNLHPQFGATMARVWLHRHPGALPSAHDLIAMAEYAKVNHNSVKGKANAE